MRIAVIGAGPAGARAAAGLARAGHDVWLLDKSFDREKPCGGGVPWAGLRAFKAIVGIDGEFARAFDLGRMRKASGVIEASVSTPAGAQRADPVLGSDTSRAGCRWPERLPDADAAPSSAPSVTVRRIVFEGPFGETATLELPRPVAVFSRRRLDRALIEQARLSGARLLEEPVMSLVDANRDASVRPMNRVQDPDEHKGTWLLTLGSGRTLIADHVVGADGARSLVRRVVSAPFRSTDLSQAVGWYAPGQTSDTMVLGFDREIAGYLWIFPRTDHLAIGACGPLRAGAAELLWASARRFLADHGISEKGLKAYSALIPTLGWTSIAANVVDGPGWSLVGDAAGTVDPLTREGIRHAVHSADLLTAAFHAGDPAGYGDLWRRTFGAELSWAAARRERFFAPDLTSRFVRYVSRSRTIRDIAIDLILGRQDYLSLKRRLLRAAPAAGLQLALSRLPARRRIPISP